MPSLRVQQQQLVIKGGHPVDAMHAVHAMHAEPKHDACACQHGTQEQDTLGAGHFMAGRCAATSPLSSRS